MLARQALVITVIPFPDRLGDLHLRSRPSIFLVVFFVRHLPGHGIRETDVQKLEGALGAVTGGHVTLCAYRSVGRNAPRSSSMKHVLGGADREAKEGREEDAEEEGRLDLHVRQILGYDQSVIAYECMSRRSDTFLTIAG